MRAVIQRVSKAEVEISGNICGEVKSGFMILLGVAHDDTHEDVEWLVKKTIALRVFNDQQGKMNLNIKQFGGSILLISQFTLQASTKKGNRPSFIKAAKPEHANPLYELFIERLNDSEIHVEKGIFGAYMKVTLTNDGPVTIIIDSKNKE